MRKRRLKKLSEIPLGGKPSIRGAMHRFFGTEVIMINPRQFSKGNNVRIKEDNGQWAWSLDWFEKETDWGFGI